MIHLVPPAAANDDLPQSVSKPVRSLDELQSCGMLGEVSRALQDAEDRHPVALTPALMDLIDPEDLLDPVAIQFVPSPMEVEADEQSLLDPIGDTTHSPVRGIVHRYPDRLLLNLIHACPSYCRFCFRRGRVGADGGVLSEEETSRAMDYIRAHKDVWEVILSGGEPLMLSVRRVREILLALRAIPHVRSVRIHTRAPITTPDIFTPDMVNLLGRGTKPVSLLIHCNHPRELGPAQRAAIGRLADAGIPLFSQSVLLAGVNDHVETLAALMRAFVECRIKPHYLHHPDKACGTRHFRLPLSRGIEIVSQLRGHVSGLCQPTYMLEIPGGHGKVPVLSDAVRQMDAGYLLRNFKGETFDYSDD